MAERHTLKEIVGIAVFAVISISAAANAQQYCVPQDGIYPPEADVVLTIGSPCDSSANLGIPIYLDNPCPVGGFSMTIVLTDIDHGVYFDVNDPLSADTSGSRISGWGYFSFNVYNPTSISITAIGPGGSEPELLPGQGLLFTVHPHYTGQVNSCQEVRFGAEDYVFDTSGYYYYGSGHETGTLCVGCDSSWPRGDANRSGTLNVVDVVNLFSHLKGVSRLCIGGCICTADFNNDDAINITDVVQMFAFLKGIGFPPDPCD